MTSEAANQLYNEHPIEGDSHQNFNLLISKLRNLESNFSKRRCHQVANELIQELTNLQIQQESLNNLQEQTLLKNQNLVQIEQGLLERENYINEQHQMLDQREMELGYERESIMALKSTQLQGKMKVKSSSVQTEMVFFKHIIKREVDLKKREDTYEIKNFNMR